MSPAVLFLLQRLSAMVLAPLVLLHMGVMIYAVGGGLDAGEILGRTRGSLFWGLVYGLFVAAVAVHGSIGLRQVVAETLGLKGRALSLLAGVVFLGLLVLGGRAVVAVVLS